MSEDGNVLIEPMAEKDLPAVAAIEKASFRDPWSEQSFQTELQYNRLATYLVARSGERVVAYIGAWLVLDEVHITTLAVDEAYRRRGIAALLLDNLTATALGRGARCMTLEVRPSNRAARSFYEKCGFRVYGQRKHYYPDEDALIMTRKDLSAPREKS